MFRDLLVRDISQFRFHKTFRNMIVLFVEKFAFAKRGFQKRMCHNPFTSRDKAQNLLSAFHFLHNEMGSFGRVDLSNYE